MAQGDRHDGPGALAAWSASLRQFPQGVLAPEATAGILSELVDEGRDREALTAADDYLGKFPADRRAAEVAFIRGNLLREKFSRTADALAAYQQALRLATRHRLKDDALFAVGACQRMLGQTAAARESFKQYQTKFPAGVHWASFTLALGDEMNRLLAALPLVFALGCTNQVLLGIDDGATSTGNDRSHKHGRFKHGRFKQRRFKHRRFKHRRFKHRRFKHRLGLTNRDADLPARRRRGGDFWARCYRWRGDCLRGTRRKACVLERGWRAGVEILLLSFAGDGGPFLGPQLVAIATAGIWASGYFGGDEGLVVASPPHVTVSISQGSSALCWEDFRIGA